MQILALFLGSEELESDFGIADFQRIIDFRRVIHDLQSIGWESRRYIISVSVYRSSGISNQHSKI
jgi:hypothetical protein